MKLQSRFGFYAAHSTLLSAPASARRLRASGEVYTRAPARRALGAAALWILGALASGCAGTVDDELSAAQPVTTPNAPSKPPEAARHFRIIAGESDVEIHVFRDGRLARLGHNHVIASTVIEGDLWLADELEDSVVELVIDKSSLTVDEPARRQAAGEEFASEPSPDAVEGTRTNMLSPALLNAVEFPDVIVRTAYVEGEWPDLTLHAQFVVADIPHQVAVPIALRWEDERLAATGQLTLSHQQLGLQPFSVMLGALRVREEMLMYYSIIAEPASG